MISREKSKMQLDAERSAKTRVEEAAKTKRKRRIFVKFCISLTVTLAFTAYLYTLSPDGGTPIVFPFIFILAVILVNIVDFVGVAIQRGTALGSKNFTITPPTLPSASSLLFLYNRDVKRTLHGDVGKIVLIRRERATYQSGSSSTTTSYDHVCLEVPIYARTWERGEKLTIRETILLPKNAVPSFKSSNNEIKWLIQLCLYFEGMREIKEEYPITVLSRSSHHTSIYN